MPSAHSISPSPLNFTLTNPGNLSQDNFAYNGSSVINTNNTNLNTNSSFVCFSSPWDRFFVLKKNQSMTRNQTFSSDYIASFYIFPSNRNADGNLTDSEDYAQNLLNLESSNLNSSNPNLQDDLFYSSSFFKNSPKILLCSLNATRKKKKKK